MGRGFENSFDTNNLRIQEFGGQALVQATESSRLRRVVLLAATRAGDLGQKASVALEEFGGQALVQSTSSTKLRRAILNAAALAGDDGELAPLAVEELGGQFLASTVTFSATRLRRAIITAATRAGSLGQKAPLTLQEFGGQALLDLDSFIETPKTPLVSDSPFFLTNWAEELEISSTWNTVRARSPQTDKIEGASLASKPRRTLQFLWTSDERSDLIRMYNALSKMTGENTLLPIYPDVGQVTAGDGGSSILFSDGELLWSAPDVLFSSSNASTEITIDTADKRFAENGALCLFARDGCMNLLDETVQYYNIREVGDGYIVLDGEEFPTLDFSGKEWFVVPVLYCKIVTEPEITHLTSGALGIRILALEEFDAAALAPSELPNSGIPEFYLAPNADEDVTSSTRREALIGEQGRSDIIEPLGSRYEYVQSWPILATRDEFWDLLRLFDGRRGRWLPFLAPDHAISNTAQGIQGTQIMLNPLDLEDFSDYGYEDWELRLQHAQWVFVKFFDGTQVFRSISQLENADSAWIITVTEAFDKANYTSSEICGVFPARTVHFENDTLIETWRTTEVVHTRFTTVENLNLGDVVVE